MEFTITTLLLENPDPKTVSVTLAEPAGIVLGLTDFTTRAGVVVLP